MHTTNSYHFETEEKAQEFVNRRKNRISPNEDTIIRGPYFMDDDVIFKDMMWASKGRKYWQVTVETYK